MGRGLRLGDVADGRSNNFRIIRHLAAWIVLAGHSLALVEPAGSAQTPLDRIALWAAALAVDTFFVVSGFLVARSLTHSRDTIDFLLGRTLRIYPGLIVLVVLTAFALGPMVTALPLGDYLRAKQVYTFVFWDSLMIVPDKFRYQLPGVFTGLPSTFGDTVNGSLWTLPWELWMYCALLAAYHLRLLRAPIMLAVLMALTIACAMEPQAWVSFAGKDMLALRFGSFFFTGVALWCLRAHVPLDWRTLGAGAATFAATFWLAGAPVLMPLGVSYAVLFAAYHPALVVPRLSHGADYSYGLYIYAYPVQQTLIWATGMQSAVLHIVASTAIATALAATSWHFVEEPALKLKQALRNRRGATRAAL